MRPQALAVVVTSAVFLLAQASEAASPQVILSHGQRLAGRIVRHIQLDPEINDAGAVLMCVELRGTVRGPDGDDDEDDQDAVVLYEPKKGTRVLALCGQSAQGRSLKE